MTATCPRCKAGPTSGRFCRKCGAELELDSGEAPVRRHPPVAPRSASPAEGQTPAPGVQPAELADPRGAATRRNRPSKSTLSTAPDRPGVRRPRSLRPPMPTPPSGQALPPSVDQNGQTPAWGAGSQVPPPSPWVPRQMEPPARRDSTALAVGLTVAVLLVALAIATTVILAVANSGSSHTKILNQSTVISPSGGAR